LLELYVDSGCGAGQSRFDAVEKYPPDVPVGYQTVGESIP
jgi:hypothetical protein